MKDLEEQRKEVSNSPGRKRNHYVYLTCDSTDGRLYWGVRSCKCKPEEDPYFGSHKDNTFQPDLKWVWNTFPTRQEAEEAEQLLLRLFDSVESQTFANLSSAQWKQWTWVGSHHTPQTKQLLSLQKQGEGNPMFGKTTSELQKETVRRLHTGKVISEETRRREQVAQREARAERAHKRLFHHPETKQQKYFDPAQVPTGWVLGEHPELASEARKRGWEKRRKT